MKTTNQRLLVLAFASFAFAPGCIIIPACDDSGWDYLDSELATNGSTGQSIVIEDVSPDSVTLHGAPNMPFYDLTLVVVNEGGELVAMIPVGRTDSKGQFFTELDSESGAASAVLLVRGFDRMSVGEEGLDLDPDDDALYDLAGAILIDERRTAQPAASRSTF